MQIVKQFDGTEISFNEDGWFNATQAAAKFDKEPAQFMRLPSTLSYIEALKRKYGNFTYLKTKRGAGGGTMLHPSLGVMFARWLDDDFSVWCDEQINAILRGTLDLKRVRHEAAATYKVVSTLLQQVRAESGKATEKHHYSNEARLINWVLTGEFKSVDRDQLSLVELDFLAKIEARDAVLIARGYTYEQRKAALAEFAEHERLVHGPIVLINEKAA